MQAELERGGPPYIPVRKGWPTHRSPKWLLATLAVFALAAVAVALSQRPSPVQRSADLAGYIKALNTDIGSCAAGVRDSLYVLRAIDTGFNHDVSTAIGVATYGANNCNLASNEQLAALATEQPPQSLASYHLDRAATALLVWGARYAPDVQNDIASILRDRGKPAEAGDRAALKAALAKLDLQRAAVSALLRPAVTAYAPKAALLALPG